MTGGGLTKQRDSHVAFIHPGEDSSWVFARVAAMVVEINARFFGFDLDGLHQGLQFTRYSAETQQHYSWHVDRGVGVGVRKLSVSIQLTDPDEYDGGELELWHGGDEPETVPRALGYATFFPAWTMHRVTPVTRGTRRSLVAWVTGPPFT